MTVGVAQVLNKRDQAAFTAADEKTLQDFPPALGIILETCVRLLSVTTAASRSIAEESDRGTTLRA